VAALRAALLLGAAVLGPGCGQAGDHLAAGGLPLLTIAECRDLGGFPLFDPADGRPTEDSCPEGLRFLGEFDESFFGADGGICCDGPEPMFGE
jgi:hypothetical protein